MFKRNKENIKTLTQKKIKTNHFNKKYIYIIYYKWCIIMLLTGYQGSNYKDIQSKPFEHIGRLDEKKN